MLSLVIFLDTEYLETDDDDDDDDDDDFYYYYSIT